MTENADADNSVDTSEAKPKPEPEPAEKPSAGDQKTGWAVKTFGVQVVVAIGVVAALLGGVVGYAAGGSKSDAAAAAAPTPLPPIQKLQLGQTGTTAKGGKVTVLTWDDKSRPPSWPPDNLGYRWSRAEVRFCTPPGNVNFRIREIPYLFNLVTTDGRLINPVVDGSHNLDELASYNIGLISASTCATGSIIFNDPTNVDIRAVRFTGSGRFDWDVNGIANGSTPAPSPSYVPGLSGHQVGTQLPGSSPAGTTYPSP